MQRTNDSSLLLGAGSTKHILTFLRPLNYSQHALLTKINTYLKMSNQPLFAEPGFCHGMTLLWLKWMAKNKELDLYHLIKKIVNTPDEHLLSIAMSIELLYRKINQKQNPKHYPKKYPQKNLSYYDVAKILGINKQHIFDCLYTKKQLSDFIQSHTKDGNIFCVTSGFSYLIDGKYTKHTIGMYVRGNQIHIFDPNYTSGQSKLLFDSQEAASEMLDRLYTVFNLQIPAQCPLEIKLLRYPQPTSIPQHTSFISHRMSEEISESAMRPKKIKPVKSPGLVSKLIRLFRAESTRDEDEKINTRLLVDNPFSH